MCFGLGFGLGFEVTASLTLHYIMAATAATVAYQIWSIGSGLLRWFGLVWFVITFLLCRCYFGRGWLVEGGCTIWDWGLDRPAVFGGFGLHGEVNKTAWLITILTPDERVDADRL